MRIADLVRDAATTGRRSYSCEFFPPKSVEGESALWQTVRDLRESNLDFVSLTYGAGGSTQETSLRIARAIVAETGLPTLAHLTCVGATAEQLNQIVDDFSAAGVRDILALRGDPVDGPGAPWVSTPGGYQYAVELVQALSQRGGFGIAVAAFPEGHPESASLAQDLDVLIAKANAGADFAITNLFFNAGRYFELVAQLRARGCELPVLPGIMPLTNLSQIERFTKLSGAEFPEQLRERFEALGDDSAAVIELGVEVAYELCVELLVGGAPGIHLYTLNRSHSSRRILQRLQEAGWR